MELKDLIVGVEHLGIMTANIQKSISWYEEKLYFKKRFQRIVPMNGRTEIAILSLKNLNLELIQPTGRLQEEAKTMGAGKWDHYAIDTPNLEMAAEEASYKNMKLHVSTPNGITQYEHLGPKGVKGINYVGPGGEVVELCHDNQKDYDRQEGYQGWAHLALKVENLARTREFYGKLGFQDVDGGYLPTPEGNIQICFLEKNGFVIEVIEMIGEGLKELKTRGNGLIDHIALEVTNVQSAMDAVRKAKLPLKNYIIQELPLLERGVRFFFIEGPDGEKVELVEKN